jgi:hypothetical protein
MDENNPVNQGSLDKEKIEQLKKEMENIGNKPTQKISSQPSQPVQHPGAFDPPPPVAPEVANSQGLNKSKGILWIALTLLLLALAGVGAYYLGSNKTANVPTPTTSPIQMPAPTPDPTTDWKMFENTVYKYTIQHPLDWTVSAPSGMDPTKFREPVFNSKCDYEAGEFCQQFFIDVVETNTATDLKPSFIIKEDDIVANEQNFTIDGQSAVGFERYQTNYNNVPGTLFYVVVTNSNGLKYTIFYREQKKDKEFKTGNDWENKKLFDQILSTFEFIEGASFETTIP